MNGTIRNHQCHCGSGLKFKRCCGDNAKLADRRKKEKEAFIERLREMSRQREREAIETVKKHDIKRARLSPMIAATLLASIRH